MHTPHRNELPAAGIGHPRVRQFLNVKHNRAPSRSSGAMAIEGLWALRHAVDAGVPVEVVFVCEAMLRGDESHGIVERLRAAGGVALSVSERVLRRIVDRDGPDGLAAIVHVPPRGLEGIAVDGSTRLVVADNVELAGNVGTLLRCADGAGAAAVVLTERRVRLAHPLVVKASMGTVFTMPVIDGDRETVHAWLRAHDVRIVAADPAAAVSYRDADYRGPVAVVVGSERYGLAPFWRSAADVIVSIPMLGVADSLNIGHAAALLLYEALSRASTTHPVSRRAPRPPHRL